MNQADKGRLQVLVDVESGPRWWASSASDTTLCEYLLLDGLAVVAELRDGPRFGDAPVERRLALTANGELALAALRARRRAERAEDRAEPGWWAWIEHETWWEFLAGPCTKGWALAAAAAYDAEAA